MSLARRLAKHAVPFQMSSINIGGSENVVCAMVGYRGLERAARLTVAHSKPASRRTVEVRAADLRALLDALDYLHLAGPVAETHAGLDTPARSGDPF